MFFFPDCFTGSPSCDKKCPNKKKYLCASNGKTFKNKCEFDKENCKRKKQGKKPLTKTKDGKCKGKLQ